MIHRRPLVTAHSGCEGTQENSLESLRAGIDAGADTAEVDVRAGQNGEPILMHDMPLGGANLAATIVTLEEALLHVSSSPVTLNLDLKDDQCIEGVVSLVMKHRMANQVVITGCSVDRARAIRALAPGIPVLLNASAPEKEASQTEYARFASETCVAAVQNHCCGINVPYSDCRPELVRQGAIRYLPVAVWTVDEEQQMLEMINMGVHSVTTHRPRKLIELLERQGTRSAPDG